MSGCQLETRTGVNGVSFSLSLLFFFFFLAIHFNIVPERDAHLRIMRTTWSYNYGACLRGPRGGLGFCC